jgi:hypothetical protein
MSLVHCLLQQTAAEAVQQGVDVEVAVKQTAHCDKGVDAKFRAVPNADSR